MTTKNKTVAEVIEFLSELPSDAFVWGWDDGSIRVGNETTELAVLSPVEKENNSNDDE